jgi:hypothetical protein
VANIQARRDTCGAADDRSADDASSAQVRVLQVVVEGRFGDLGMVTGPITLDEKGDMVFSNPVDIVLISRFYRLRSVEVNQTDRQVFDPQYDGS